MQLHPFGPTVTEVPNEDLKAAFAEKTEIEHVDNENELQESF